MTFYQNVSLANKEYQLFVDLVYQKSGIHLGENKRELVKGRLMKRIRFHRFKSFEEYYSYVKNDTTEKEIVELLNAISTNVTYFFRESDHFDFLLEVAIGEIAKQKRKYQDNEIRIWSAACSSGEEVYSILFALNEYLARNSQTRIRVLGTDISTKVLNIALHAVYDESKLDKLPLHLKSKYLQKQRQEDLVYYSVDETIKKMAVFRRLNLMNDRFPFKKQFSVIFCRNVMIYFDKETQERLIEKFYRYLEPGGYLFVGHSESVIGINTRFNRVGPAVFRKE